MSQHRVVHKECFFCGEDAIDLFVRHSRMSGSERSFCTSICECQRDFSNKNRVTFWTKDMILHAVDLIEKGISYSNITDSLRSAFPSETTFMYGRQRAGGKGFDGAVVKKFERLWSDNSCEWNDSMTDVVLASLAFETYRNTKHSREERKFDSAMKVKKPLNPTLASFDESICKRCNHDNGFHNEYSFCLACGKVCD